MRFSVSFYNTMNKKNGVRFFRTLRNARSFISLSMKEFPERENYSIKVLTF